MATLSRSLRVEAIEDRVVPSTMTIVSMGFYGPIYGMTSTFQDRGETFGRMDNPSYGERGSDQFFAPRSEGFGFSSGFAQPVFIDIIAFGGNWNNVVSVSPAPSPGSSPSSQGGNDAATSTPDAIAPTSTQVASRPAGHGATNSASDVSADRSAAIGNSSVSVSSGLPSALTGSATSAAVNAAVLASQQVAPNAQPLAFETRPMFGHLAVPISAVVELPDSRSAEVPMAPQSEEPPLAPIDPPAVMPETASTPTEAPPTIATGDPLPGHFPFNLTAIETGVRGVLDRVADLEQTFAETTAGAEDYLWLAAATLVAGGIAQTAWTRRTRPTDPRTLGLDSVLARWGERYVG
jgi:hypothetical protein